MNEQKINAPQRITDAIEKARETIDRINLELQAMLFGASAALDVPDGWTWDGSGWVAPEHDNVTPR
jgi:hypothetical protein